MSERQYVQAIVGTCNKHNRAITTGSFIVGNNLISYENNGRGRCQDCQDELIKASENEQESLPKLENIPIKTQLYNCLVGFGVSFKHLPRGRSVEDELESLMKRYYTRKFDGYSFDTSCANVSIKNYLQKTIPELREEVFGVQE